MVFSNKRTGPFVKEPVILPDLRLSRKDTNETTCSLQHAVETGRCFYLKRCVASI